MSFTSKNGKAYGSRYVAKRHDMAIAEPKRELKEEKHEQHQTIEAPKPSEVVKEHGPATMVTVEHEAGKHSVESEHKDGHVHNAEFTSPEEAHEHAKKLAAFEKDEQGVNEAEDSAEQGGDSPFDFDDAA